VTNRPNSALVHDVCAAALRAFYNAPQRGRWAEKSIALTEETLP
jgi:hypothetical protein